MTEETRPTERCVEMAATGAVEEEGGNTADTNNDDTTAAPPTSLAEQLRLAASGEASGAAAVAVRTAPLGTEVQ